MTADDRRIPAIANQLRINDRGEEKPTVIRRRKQT